MSIIDGPNLSTTNDLIFYLDAGNSRSYPGTGSVWYDLTSNQNHFTLFNSPSYVQAGTSGTYFTFNGTNQYARSTNAINFNAYSALTIEIAFRSTGTQTQILYETTGTGGSTATGGITLLMNSDNTSTVSNAYLSNWQGYGARIFGFSSSAATTFNLVTETFVKGVDSAGRISYVNGLSANYLTNSSVTTATSTTTSGLSFSNTWTYIASRAGTSNLFKGDIAWIKAYGTKVSSSNIAENLRVMALRQTAVHYTGSTFLSSIGGGSPFVATKFTSAGGETQTYIAPRTGTYKFVLVGAGGSSGSAGSGAGQQNGAVGGFGGVLVVDISLTVNDVVTMYIGKGQTYNTITYGNGAAYPLRGGTAGTGGGAGGGGTAIYKASPGALANYSGYLAIAGGGGGSASHGFPGNVGGQGIGYNQPNDGAGYGYSNNIGPVSPSGSSNAVSTSSFSSGQLTGGTGTSGSSNNGGGGGGGGAGGGGAGIGGGSGDQSASASARGGFLTLSYTGLQGAASGNRGGGGHDGNCGGTGGGGGCLAFTAFNAALYYVTQSSMVTLKQNNLHSNLNTISNFTEFNTPRTLITNAGLTWTNEGTPGWVNATGSATSGSYDGAIWAVSCTS